MKPARAPSRGGSRSRTDPNAFAAGTVLALGSPALAPIAFVVAASVAASRVFLGFHFLTDVLAGAALGFFIGAGAFQVALR